MRKKFIAVFYAINIPEIQRSLGGYYEYRLEFPKLVYEIETGIDPEQAV